jgi:predicted methyltransferase
MLGIISRDKTFIKELKDALNKLNFIVSLSNKNLYIYKKEEIDRFFREIKPSNMKHNKKYLYYKKNKKVPLTKELIKR